MTDYAAFLARRAQHGGWYGFDATIVPDWLFPFQRDLVQWVTRRGRGALFADCGLGKTPMQLVWAQNVVKHTGRSVLLCTPLAVSHQVVREAAKFDIECERLTGTEKIAHGGIYVTNYERLHLFNASDFVGAVCDESSILKNFDGARKASITEFLRTLPYRLLCTATAAPNDYIELGTSSEALGELGYLDMLMRFFKNDQNAIKTNRHWDGSQWRFKKHAERPFWRWVCSWARAIRRPSDLGHDDAEFVLPPLHEVTHMVEARTTRDGWLFEMPAVGFHEEREERRRTVTERCERVAALVNHGEQSLVWCHLNAEGDLLRELIPDAEQVQGSDSDDVKEDRLQAFARGDLRVLVTKPKIGAWGLNLQNCAHVTFFPSHSYEQYYQAVRRCWRFGQTRAVTVDIICTEGQRRVMANLQRKAEAASQMFTALVAYINEALHLEPATDYTNEVAVPAWL
jgi:hypothetical protein